MNRGPDVCIVNGVRARYSCRDVAEVDSHLRGVMSWLARNLPTLNPERQARVRAQYRYDLDALLDARVMLMALRTLNVDFEALSMAQARGAYTPGLPLPPTLPASQAGVKSNRPRLLPG